MKKVIYGKVYDTSTAKELGHHEPNPYRSDFGWYYETLYQKKTGEFFIHGEGNAASPYCTHCAHGGSDPGEKIKPLTYEEAQKWSEKHLTAEEYEQIFGAIDENEETVRTTISTTAAELEAIKRNAAKEGLTVSAYIVRMCAR